MVSVWGAYQGDSASTHMRVGIVFLVYNNFSSEAYQPSSVSFNKFISVFWSPCFSLFATFYPVTLSVAFLTAPILLVCLSYLADILFCIYCILCLNIALIQAKTSYSHGYSLIHSFYTKLCEYTALNGLMTMSAPAYPLSSHSINTVWFSQTRAGSITLTEESKHLYMTRKEMFTIKFTIYFAL